MVNDPEHPPGTEAHDKEYVPPMPPTVGDTTVGVPHGEVYDAPRNSNDVGNASEIVTFVAPAGIEK